jgi:hypothetical protein
MVEAMWKANWPAQEQLTEAEQAAPRSTATCGLEGVPSREEGIVSPRGPGVGIEGVHLKGRSGVGHDSEVRG